MVAWLTRADWDARPRSGGGVALRAADIDGTALHWPGMSSPIDAAGDIGKRRVASALRGWQNYHMDVRGWSDIAYQAAVDQAGRKWTLRGLPIKSGANGNDDVNTRYGAILLILGPGEAPSAAMKATTREVVAEFKARFPGCRSKPYGHRDVRPAGTDCPGPLAYAAIQRGEFTPGATPPPPPPPEDVIDMATLAELTTASAKGTEIGNREYWADFYSPGGTGASLKKTQEAILAESVKQTAALDRIAVAVEALAPKA